MFKMKVLNKTSYDTKGHTDENSLYAFRLRNPDKITSSIIFEEGLDSGKFPLLAATEGQAGCGALLTGAKICYAEKKTASINRADIVPEYVEEGDLAGKYDFVYSVSVSITYDDVTGMDGEITALATEGDVVLDVGEGTWSGSLVEYQ